MGRVSSTKAEPDFWHADYILAQCKRKFIMIWKNRRQSSNIEDRRGMGGMGRGALPVGGGIGTLVLGLVVYFLTGDSSVITQSNPGPGAGGSQITRSQNPANQTGSSNDEAKQFVSVVLADTEEVWGKFFEQRGQRYEEPKLVLFSGQTRSACGVAASSSGPFYCPSDRKLYMDLDFLGDLQRRLGAQGDFAQAYVIAHEVGHHVQNLMGTLGKVQALQNRVSERESNALSVRVELQADFYAGVWARYAARRGVLETGDIEEAIGAAAAVGDDRIQSRSQGSVVPDSFTHGTSAQRVEWFTRGLQTGDLKQGNTFGPDFR
jgi:predicted metalloprotease